MDSGEGIDREWGRRQHPHRGFWRRPRGCRNCRRTNGDPGGTRTHNTRLKRPVLCQLSYRVKDCSLAQLAHGWQAEKCGFQGPAVPVRTLPPKAMPSTRPLILRTSCPHAFPWCRLPAIQVDHISRSIRSASCRKAFRSARQRSVLLTASRCSLKPSTPSSALALTVAIIAQSSW